MAQQTAVGFIEEQIKIYLPSIHQKGLQDVFGQAKAMEKEQIMNAFNDSELHNTGNENCAEIYYNYIYNKM